MLFSEMCDDMYQCVDYATGRPGFFATCFVVLKNAGLLFLSLISLMLCFAWYAVVLTLLFPVCILMIVWDFIKAVPRMRPGYPEILPGEVVW